MQYYGVMVIHLTTTAFLYRRPEDGQITAET